MRKPSLITAILLLSSAWVIAQSSSTPPTVPDSSQANQPASASQQPDAAQQKEPMGTGQNEQSLEGCISRGAVGYTLTDNAGKTYQLAGDTSKLADEVGHWDRVSGSQEGGAASSGAPATFTVTKVKVVSTTCPTK